MMSKDGNRMSIKSMGSVLQVKIYREILSDIYYEQALELFLTEYPNGKNLEEKVFQLDM